MTKTTTIPAGYKVTVTSWENDADNYNTKFLDGISDEDTVRFHVALCALCERGSRYANLYDPSDALVEAFNRRALEIANLYQHILPEDVTTDEDKVEYCVDTLYEYGITAGEFFTRVCESIKVEYASKPVYLEDVTNQFIN